jgi:hypothetical protein
VRAVTTSLARATPATSGRDIPSPALSQARPRGKSRLRLVLLLNLTIFSVAFMLAEAGFRCFATPRYWIHTDKLLVGSGQTRAGKKLWPDTLYRVDSSEFHAIFQTNHAGYRARPGSPPGQSAYRIAFVGDSFTEGMQVNAEATFCARIERALNEAEKDNRDKRPFVCENYGVAATDLLEYYHRIVHDVVQPDPPDAMVLCIYPGNDFLSVLPDDAFEQDGRPVRAYFDNASWSKHLIAWVNLHSQFGSYIQRVIFSIGASKECYLSQGPQDWWTDPRIAATAPDAPAIRRTRALLAAIRDECRHAGTRLCMLVVGPVIGYQAIEGKSPLASILADWQLDIPVIDVAISARARPDWARLLFPCDGHLTEGGHDYIAQLAAPSLRSLLRTGAR